MDASLRRSKRTKSKNDLTTISGTRNSRRFRLNDTRKDSPRVANTVHDESIATSSSRRRTRSKSSVHENQPVTQLDIDSGEDLHSPMPSHDIHDDDADSPQRSPSIPYSFGTPASSLASPIRDAGLISLPIKPELDAVLRNIVENMGIIHGQDRADLERIFALKAAAIKLHAQAEGLRATLRAEKGARERLENYVSTWRSEQPGWSLLDVWEGEYNVKTYEDGEFVLDPNGRPIELDSEDEGDAIHVPCRHPVEPSPPNRSQYHDLGESRIPRQQMQIRSQKRPREDTRDTEEEGRYQRRSWSQETVTRSKQTENQGQISVTERNFQLQLLERLNPSEILQASCTIPRKRRYQSSKDDEDHVRYQKRRRFMMTAVDEDSLAKGIENTNIVWGM